MYFTGKTNSGQCREKNVRTDEGQGKHEEEQQIEEEL